MRTGARTQLLLSFVFFAAFGAGSAAVARPLFAQAPVTRTYAIAVRQSTGGSSYRLTVYDSAGAPSADVVKLLPPSVSVKPLASFRGELADSIVATLYALDVWQLASPDAKDGTCPTVADPGRLCGSIADGTSLEIVVSAGSEVRRQVYHAPAGKPDPVWNRVQRLIDFVLDLGSTSDQG